MCKASNYICPQGIVGLKDLFLPPKRGNAEDESWGFRRGSSILVSGPPGSGKTTFALSILRSLMKQKGSSKRAIAYYISVEVDRDRLRRMYADRGWFAPKQGDNSPYDPLFDDKNRDRHEGLHVIKTPLEIERPVRTTEELLNHITAEIARRPQPEEDQDVYLVVDSITSLLKDSSGPGEERRQTHELLHRLRSQFPDRRHADKGNGKNPLALMFLLSEHAGATALAPDGYTRLATPVPKVEDYVANYVVHLDTNMHSLGHKTRVLEFTKSQGSHIMMGQHSWMILTNNLNEPNPNFPDAFSRRIVGKSLRNQIRKSIDSIETALAREDSNLEDYINLFVQRHVEDNQDKAKEEIKEALNRTGDNLSDEDKESIFDFAYRKYIGLEEKEKTGGAIAESKLEKVGQFYKVLDAYKNKAIDSPEIRPFYRCGNIVIARRAYVAAGEFADVIHEQSGNNGSDPKSNSPGDSKSSENEIWSGILGLDQMLKKEATSDQNELSAVRYWINDIGRVRKLADEDIKGAGKPVQALKPGDVSIIVGEPGSGKSSLCLPFLFASQVQLLLEKNEAKNSGKYDNEKQSNSQDGNETAPQSVNKPEDEESCLFISFENDPNSAVKSFSKETQLSEKKLNAEYIFRPRNALEFNLLLLEVRCWLLKNHDKHRRVVIDGVSDLLSSHERLAVTQMLDALLSTFKTFDRRFTDNTKLTTLLLTYEEKDISSKQMSDSYRIPADNLITLKKINIRDEARHSIQVIKSSNEDYDRYMREVIFDRKQIFQARIISGFDGYTGLTSIGRELKKASVILEFFEENPYEEQFNLELVRKLNGLFPYKFETRKITKERLEKTASLNSAETSDPKADLYINNIDQWAIPEKSDIFGHFPKHKNSSDRKYRTGYADYGMLTIHNALLKKICEKHPSLAYSEIEKCFPPAECADSENEEQNKIGFLQRHEDENKLKGLLKKIFCDLPWFERTKDKSLSKLLEHWHKEANESHDLFNSSKGGSSVSKSFLSLVTSDTVHECTEFHSKDDNHKYKRPIFSFDLESTPVAASFLVELTKSFELTQEDAEGKCSKDALQIALAFIGFLASQGILDTQPTPYSSMDALITRQYYAAFRSINLMLQNEPSNKAQQHCLVPFLPLSPFQKGISYTCNGTWSLAYHADTPSAGLGPEIINTLLTGELEIQRAQFGAGLPCSDEFYNYYGGRSITGAPYWCWSDLLRVSTEPTEKEITKYQEDFKKCYGHEARAVSRKELQLKGIFKEDILEKYKKKQSVESLQEGILNNFEAIQGVMFELIKTTSSLETNDERYLKDIETLVKGYFIED